MIRCPQCRNEIPADDFNVATDRAFCRACQRDYRYGELAAAVWPDVELDLATMPKHLRLVDDGFQQTIVYHRISRMLILFVPFAAVWSGGSMWVIYLQHLVKGKPVPDDRVLDGLPFLIATLVMLAAIVYMLFGKVTIRLQGADSWIFTGVGPIGWRKRFDAENLESIRIVDSGARVNGQEMDCIELQFRERGVVRFGTFLTPESKQFIATYLARQYLT